MTCTPTFEQPHAPVVVCMLTAFSYQNSIGIEFKEGTQQNIYNFFALPFILIFDTVSDSKCEPFSQAACIASAISMGYEVGNVNNSGGYTFAGPYRTKGKCSQGRY